MFKEGDLVTAPVCGQRALGTIVYLSGVNKQYALVKLFSTGRQHMWLTEELEKADITPEEEDMYGRDWN